MDALTTALTIAGSIAGAAGASFTAVWRFLVVPARDQAEASAADQGDAADLRREFDSFKARVEPRCGTSEKDQAVMTEKVDQLERRVTELADRLDRALSRLNTFVTDEEWQAGQNQLQQSVTALTEKVGRTVGAIEAWQTRGAR